MIQFIPMIMAAAAKALPFLASAGGTAAAGTAAASAAAPAAASAASAAGPLAFLQQAWAAGAPGAAGPWNAAKVLGTGARLAPRMFLGMNTTGAQGGQAPALPPLPEAPQSGGGGPLHQTAAAPQQQVPTGPRRSAIDSELPGERLPRELILALLGGRGGI